jgi:enamine deaminase RidA (YjgF/YER057c/UK114 family)
MSTPSQRLADLGLSLPSVAKPVGAYVPALKHHDMLILSGQIPVRDGKVTYTGKVGGLDGVSVDDAQLAARLCALNALAAAAGVIGSIDRITRVLKVVCYVAGNEGFSEPHRVANGASDLLAEVFEDAGKHARAAVTVAGLPLDSSVEIDITFAIEE